MAYHFTQATGISRDAVFDQIHDYLVNTVGWTDHDDRRGEASPYFILKSSGESGKEHIYLHVYTSSTAYIYFKHWLYWDNVAHSGVNGSHYGNIYCNASSNNIWFYADLDCMSLFLNYSTAYSYFFAGAFKRHRDTGVAITQQVVSSGNNIVIPVDDASEYFGGERLQIRDDLGIEYFNVAAVDIGNNTITADRLDNGYVSGASVGVDVVPVLIAGNLTGGAGYTLTTPAFGYDVSSKKQEAGAKNLFDYGEAYVDPDARLGEHIMFPLIVYSKGYDYSTTHYRYEALRGSIPRIFRVSSASPVFVHDIDSIEANDGYTYRILKISSYFFAVRENAAP